jgi:hypothetical protein
LKYTDKSFSFEQAAGGSGTFCCIWNYRETLTGGLFNTLSGTKREDPQSEVHCTGTMETNVFGHAFGAEGVWEIRADDLANNFTQSHRTDDVKETFAQLYGEFKTLASDERLGWLQNHGAVHTAQLHDGEVSLIFKSSL